MAAALFAQEPFRSRRTDFNIWGLCPPAAQSGISRPSTGVYRRAPAGSSYDAFGAERYILTFDNRAWRDIAAWAPYEFVTILANNNTYGGGGLYNVFSTAAVDNDFADYLFVHEFAHHFAGLADEYYTSPNVYEPPDRIVEPWPGNVTAERDRDDLKWRDLLDAGVPVPTPWPKAEFEALQKTIQARRVKLRADNRPEAEMTALFREELELTTKLLSKAEHAGKVGLFQGANYDAQAFYRSEIDCIMFTRNRVPFCRACQRALTETIDRHTSSSTRPAQARATGLEMNFVASAETFRPAAEAYRDIWAADGGRIVAAMARSTGLRFEPGPIEVVVYEGTSYSGEPGGRPMFLRASYPNDTKRGTLVHELAHRLANAVPFTGDHHELIFLFVYDVWVDLWGQSVADEQVRVESRRKGGSDYEGIWKRTLALPAAERARRLAGFLGR
jgi:hypothetical protein